ncbi:MAG: hypothetical protein WCF23_19685 [Candidatus Nitrosopolaris sp.]
MYTEPKCLRFSTKERVQEIGNELFANGGDDVKLHNIAGFARAAIIGLKVLILQNRNATQER